MSNTIDLEEGWAPIRAAIDKLEALADARFDVTTYAPTGTGSSSAVSGGGGKGLGAAVGDDAMGTGLGSGAAASALSRGPQPASGSASASAGGAKPFTNKEYMAVYHVCYKMSTQRAPYNWSEQLYARHGESLRSYLRSKVLPVLRSKHGVQLLQEVAVRWGNHGVMNKWMGMFFTYLNRYYVEHHNKPTLQDAGLSAFRTEIYEPIKRTLTDAFIAQVGAERAGEVVDRSLLSSIADIYVQMGDGTLDCYTADLQAPLLAATQDNYRARASTWLEGGSIPAYLARVEECLVQEATRVQVYLHEATEPELLRICETVLLADQQQRIMDAERTGIRTLLRDDKREDLARVYRLFARIPDGLAPIARLVREHYQDIGLGLVRAREAGTLASSGSTTAGAAGGAGASSGKEGGSASGGSGKEDPSDPSFIQSLLDLHDRARGVVNTEFGGNTMFQKALKDAFEVFVNKEVPSSKYSNGELLAHYIDRQLRTGAGAAALGAGATAGSAASGGAGSEAALEEGLERCVSLFAHVADKDIFGDIYRSQLSKRLLNGRSLSTDAERSMIGKFKLRCGAQYTSKMEGMLNDLASAEGAARDFKTQLAAPSSPSIAQAAALVPRGLDFSVQVLTTGFWPTFPRIELRLPKEFQDCQAAFGLYYAAKTQHRKLDWVHSLGTANVKGNYVASGGAASGKGAGGLTSYEFSVTTLQALAMLLFSERASPLDLDGVREALGCDIEVAKRVLHSLSCGKYRVLTKTPESSVIGPADTFIANDAFSCPLRKVRIPMASLEDAHNPKRVEEDRSLTIEACIVRVMKARKSMTHQALISEVMGQLHFFRPNPKVIKKRIEHLIEREYLERDTADANVYKYLA